MLYVIQIHVKELLWSFLSDDSSMQFRISLFSSHWNQALKVLESFIESTEFIGGYGLMSDQAVCKDSMWFVCLEETINKALEITVTDDQVLLSFFFILE